MTTPDPTRSKAIEVMARAYAARMWKSPPDEVGETWRWYADDMDAALTAYESHLHAEGMAVVPVEPTEAMHDAARDWSHAKYGKPIGTDASEGCWTAMIAASQEKDA